MATTFDVIFLGTGPSIDATEGDFVSENAGALVGQTYGSAGDPLVDNIGSFSPGSTGFGGGDAARYDTNNNVSNDTFRVDGGADQTVDGLAIYNATITYVDGTTATITAVVMQDTAGNLYLVPETTFNADQAALEAKPIRALTLDSVNSNNTSMTADRYDANFDTSDGTVNGTGGDDSMGVGYTDGDGDQITGNDDVIEAGAGNDTVDAGDGNDTIDGGTGNDSLTGGAGDDVLTGGDGNDTLQGDGAGAASNQLTNGTFDSGTAGWTRTGDVDWEAGFVNLTLDSGSGTLSYDTTLTGLDAGDSVNGTGQIQFDFHWANGSPDVNGTTHIDVQIGGVTYATIETGGNGGSFATVTYLNGATGNNPTVSVSTWETITLDLPADVASSGTLTFAVDASTESARDDIWLDNVEVLTASSVSGDDVLTGGDGDDVISGGAGSDNLSGGADADTFLIEDAFGNDTITGGETTTTGTDFDTIDLSAVTTGVTVDWSTSEAGTIVSGADTITFSEVEQIIFTDLADNIDASAETAGLNFDAGGGNDSISDGSGSDTIFGGTGNDFILASFGNDVISGGAGDDSIASFFGDNTMSGGTGDDVIYTGSGSDIITGGDGDDVISGGAGSDNLSGGADADTFLIEDGFGNDTITGGETTTTGTDFDTIDLSAVTTGVTVDWNTSEAGTIVSGAYTITFSGIEQIIFTDRNDSINASAETVGLNFDAGGGNDSIRDGSGNDTIYGGAGYDRATLTGGGGDDYIEGVERVIVQGVAGNDTLNMTSGSGSVALNESWNLSFTDATNAVSSDGTYTLNLTNYYDFDAFGAANQLDASLSGTAISYHNYGSSDTVTGSAFDDLFYNYSSSGSNIYDGGLGNDYIEGGGGSNTIFGGDGNDTIIGAVGSSSAGSADYLVGGTGDDLIFAQGGDDTIIGGVGADTLEGSAGNDIFIYNVGDGNDTITDFNAGTTGSINDGISTNNDFIDLSGFYDHISELYADQADDGILNQSNTTDTRGNATDYSDNSQFSGGSIEMQGASADSSSFTQENTGVVCFTTGTAILTPRGDVLIDDLRVGDLVITADNGSQPIRWISKRQLDHTTLMASPNLRPVLINAGVLGNEKPLLVSPQHCMMVGNNNMARAKHMAETMQGIRVAHGKQSVCYVHLMFDTHQIIFAENTPSESFFPGPMSLKMMPPEARAELLTLFPELAGHQGCREYIIGKYGETARPIVAKRALPELLTIPLEMTA